MQFRGEGPERRAVHADAFLAACSSRVAVLGEDYRRTLPARRVLEHLAHLAGGLAHHHGHTFLDDAGLLCGDLRGCVAEYLRVVHGDVGDYAQIGPHNVGAVEPAAQSHLHHSHVNALAGEIFQSHHGGELEERRTEVARGAPRVVSLHEVGYGLAVNHAPVHTDALEEVGEVGRCVQPRLVACRLQRGGYQAGSRAFAVGAGHMHRAQPILRVAEACRQVERSLQARFVRTRAKFLERRVLCHQFVYSFFRIHSISCFSRSLSGCTA